MLRKKVLVRKELRKTMVKALTSKSRKMATILV